MLESIIVSTKYLVLWDNMISWNVLFQRKIAEKGAEDELVVPSTAIFKDERGKEVP